MGRMKDFDIRIRGGGDAAIDAVSELLEASDRELRLLQYRLRWIPVRERPPERGVDVLVITKHHPKPVVMSLRPKGGQWDWDGDVDSWHVTHWTTIPEAPE